MKTGIELIAAERQEQIEKHGWTLEHDAGYRNDQLSQAAFYCFDLAGYNPMNIHKKHSWPDGWDDYFEEKIKAKTKIQQIVVGAAFLIADNDRRGDNFWAQRIKDAADEIDRLQNTQP